MMSPMSPKVRLGFTSPFPSSQTLALSCLWTPGAVTRHLDQGPGQQQKDRRERVVPRGGIR